MKLITILLLMLPGLVFADLEDDKWEDSWSWSVGLLFAEQENTQTGEREQRRGWSSCVGGDRYHYDEKFTIGVEGCLLISPGNSDVRIEGGEVQPHTHKYHTHHTHDGKPEVVDTDTGFNSLTAAVTGSYPFVQRLRFIGQVGYAWKQFDDGRVENDTFWAVGIGRPFGGLQTRILYRHFNTDTDLDTLGIEVGIAF